MVDLDKAYATQLANIEKKTGKSLAELTELARASGFTTHRELRQYLQTQQGLGYGDANALVAYVQKQINPDAATPDSADDAVAAYYTGPKAALHPIHERVMVEVNALGEFETAPKKTYLAFRRKKQFAMLGPATSTRVELGLNIKNLPASERLLAQPAGSMCNYVIRLTAPEQVDEELVGWLRQAYESAG